MERERERTMAQTQSRSSRTALLAAIPVLIILVPLGYSIVSYLLARDAGTPSVFLERPDPKYQACVRETPYMRFHHWQFLRTVREEVVRFGMRGDAGLRKCGECHTSRERFCDRCHLEASVNADCWGCHYYP